MQNQEITEIPLSGHRNWKAELELEQLKSALEYRQNGKNTVEEKE